jgi:serine phosphatase RsbU (regulator of sigma subunit)
MSIIGITLLNEIVQTKKIHDVDQVLNHLHDGIYQLLHQGESDNKDGMEATLCCIDTANKILNYSGSGNPLIYFRNNECHTVKSSSLAIGGKRTRQEGTFERHVIDLQGLQEVYLFTDGLQDQFGGENTRKMGIKNILSFLGSVHNEPMDVQKTKLQSFLDHWMAAGKRPERQIDDILLIGFRL